MRFVFFIVGFFGCFFTLPWWHHNFGFLPIAASFFNIRDKPLLTHLLVSLSFVLLFFLYSPYGLVWIFALFFFFPWVWSSLPWSYFIFLSFNNFYVMALCLA